MRLDVAWPGSDREGRPVCHDIDAGAAMSFPSSRSARCAPGGAPGPKKVFPLKRAESEGVIVPWHGENLFLTAGYAEGADVWSVIGGIRG